MDQEIRIYGRVCLHYVLLGVLFTLLHKYCTGSQPRVGAVWVIHSLLKEVRCRILGLQLESPVLNMSY